MSDKYNHLEIDKKWQEKWNNEQLYKTKEDGGDKYYILDMFPYPSGAGLHVGHPKGYIATDIFARMKMMQGFSVLHPMGWDAFGLPAENYAIKNKVHPSVATDKNVKTFKEQLFKLGLSYDWDREVNTTDPKFYKWTQWIFSKMFEHGLAFESNEPINWCPKCQTGLANEDLEDGRCERCDSEIERKPMRQWVLKITDYADRMLNDLDKLPEWEGSIKEMQRNWIGKSSGAKVKFIIKAQNSSQNDAELTQNSAENLLYKDLTYKIRGALFNVRKGVGLGHKEDVYHKALEIEFRNQELLFESEKKIDVKYDGKKVGVYQPDFVVEDKVIIELKSVPKIGKQQLNQVWTYLKGSDYKLAMLVNYSPADLEIKRMVYDNAREEKTSSVFSASSQHNSATSTGVEVFTTRPDTLFGATYMVLAPEHELITNYELSITNYGEVKEYIKKAQNKSDMERTELNKEKTGVRLEGIIAVNPVNGEEIPVYIADYVMMGYGTGAIMAVPAHDERDWEFAKKYNISIREVVSGGEVEKEVYSGNGKLVNSEFLNGLEVDEAKNKMIEWLKEKDLGEKSINYKLKDWVFSRQRYWGEPIPLIYCEHCKDEIENGDPDKVKEAFSKGEIMNPGWVLDENLPLELPAIESYEPSGTGESPLATIDEFVNTTCPKCGGTAKRETNTMPQWAGSSWYYLRYMDPHNENVLVDLKKEKYWSPVDFYVGGAEHATRHLIYARFWHKFLYDIGVVSTEEPFKRLQHVGLILAEDGRKMSKRWGNVINPDDIVIKYGADAMRVYEMFMGPFGQSCAWNTRGLVGARKFLDKVWGLKDKLGEAIDKDVDSLTHKTIKKVGEDIEEFKFNTAISSMMILVNKMIEKDSVFVDNYKNFIKILSSFAPYFCEEIWRKELGHETSIFKEKWPKYDENLIQDKTVELVVQINGKLRDKMEVSVDISEEDAKTKALESEKIKIWLKGKEVLKIIFVKGKLLNIVIK